MLHLRVCLETRQRSEANGEPREPFAERVGVLTDEQCGRCDEGNLLARHDCFECRANRDLGLAEPHVTSEQAVHRNFTFHVCFDLVDGRELVWSLVIREGVFELTLPRSVRRKRKSLGLCSSGVQLDKLHRDFTHSFAGSALRGRPVRSAHFAQCWVFTSDVSRDESELVGWHEQFVAGEPAFARRIFDDEVFALGFLLRA